MRGPNPRAQPSGPRAWHAGAGQRRLPLYAGWRRSLNLLRQMEQTVLEEGREWMRRRLEQRLQAASDALEAVCPKTGQGLSETRWRDLQMTTVAGGGGETARPPRLLGRTGPVGLSRTVGLGHGSLPAGESGIGGTPVLYRHRSRLLRAGRQDGHSLGQPRER